jgi:hypothetical protein
VSIYQAGDGGREADGVRDMMREECPPGLDFRSRNPEAYEISGQRPGEYVFVLNYLPRLTRDQPVGWSTEGSPPYIPGLSDPEG